MRKRESTSNPDEFYEAMEKGVAYQGIRATARRAKWHPSKVHRALKNWGRVSIRDAIVLSNALGTWIEFGFPQIDQMRPRATGRPKRC